MKPLQRRSFIQLASALAGTCSLSSPGAALFAGQQSSPAPSEFLDAVIIGGGISGLVAADSLIKQGYRKIKVLEVRSRVGGRTLNQPTLGGGIAEAGGQWIGPTQTAIAALMADLGISSFPTYSQGTDVDDTNGNISLAAYLDYLSAESALNAFAKKIPLSAPWSYAGAAQLDAMSVQDWMDINMSTAGGKSLLALEIGASLSTIPERLSLLYFLFFIHSGGDLNQIGVKAQEQRITGGSQSISLALAQRLGSKVQLSTRVKRIRYHSGGARIETNRGVLRAKKVIVAMMPKDIERMDFRPFLPPQRSLLQRNWTSAPGAKFHAVYPSAFWRANGQSGQAISHNQFLVITFDNSPASGTPGILIGFAADENNIPASRAARRALTLDSFAAFFGPQAYNAIDYKEYNWALDPLTSGCVSPLEPGVLSAYGPALRTPVGPIHWAGTETSEVWMGYMDGAVRAGLSTTAHWVPLWLASKGPT